jgi:hypothetical protein
MARSISKWGIQGSKNAPSRTSPQSLRRPWVPRTAVPWSAPIQGSMPLAIHSTLDIFNSRFPGNGSACARFEPHVELFDRANQRCQFPDQTSDVVSIPCPPGIQPSTSKVLNNRCVTGTVSKMRRRSSPPTLKQSPRPIEGLQSLVQSDEARLRVAGFGYCVFNELAIVRATAPPAEPLAVPLMGPFRTGFIFGIFSDESWPNFQRTLAARCPPRSLA